MMSLEEAYESIKIPQTKEQKPQTQETEPVQEDDNNEEK